MQTPIRPSPSRRWQKTIADRRDVVSALSQIEAALRKLRAVVAHCTLPMNSGKLPREKFLSGPIFGTSFVANSPSTQFMVLVGRTSSLSWGSAMEIVHPFRRQRDRADRDPHPGDEHMDDLGPLLEENVSRGDARPHAGKADVLSLLEENARLRGLVVKLSNIIIKSIADQK
jgi:hypothetical protein